MFSEQFKMISKKIYIVCMTLIKFIEFVHVFSNEDFESICCNFLNTINAYWMGGGSSDLLQGPWWGVFFVIIFYFVWWLNCDFLYIFNMQSIFYHIHPHTHTYIHIDPYVYIYSLLKCIPSANNDKSHWIYIIHKVHN